MKQILLHFEKDGYDIEKRVLFKDRPEELLPDVRTITPSDHALNYSLQAGEQFLLTKTKGDDDMYFAYGQMNIRRTGRRLYASTNYLAYVMLRDGRLRKRGPLPDELLREIIRFKRLECLYLEDEMIDSTLRLALSCGPVLRRVLRGRLSNRHDVVSAYLASAWKVRRVNVELADRFFRCRNIGQPSLADLEAYTTDLNHALDVYAQYDRSLEGKGESETCEQLRRRATLFNDLVGDAVRLDKAVNPLWSARRMHEEHQKNIRLIIEKESNAQDDTNIYGSEAVSDRFRGFRFTTVNSARGAFLESKTMQHCLFYNYWKRIKKGLYLALHADGPCPVTVGVRLSDDGKTAVVDQVQAFHNTAPDSTTHAVSMEFVKRNAPLLRRLMTAVAVAPAVSAPANAQVDADNDNPFDDLPY